jgi:hypothetical protein
MAIATPPRSFLALVKIQSDVRRPPQLSGFAVTIQERRSG